MNLTVLTQEEQPEDVTELLTHIRWIDWLEAILVLAVALFAGRLLPTGAHPRAGAHPGNPVRHHRSR